MMPALAQALQTTLHRASRPAPIAGLQLAIVYEALERAEALIVRPVLRLVPTPVPSESVPLEDTSSDWDPEPVTREVLVAVVRQVAEETDQEEPLERDHALALQEINGSKALLLEVVRRASFDWILYRTSRRMAYRSLADQAYNWLFVECEGTPEWDERQRDGKWLTSFESICEALDLDSDTVRRHIRKLTPKHVTGAGRPSEGRRQAVPNVEEVSHGLPSGMIDESEAASDAELIY
jgi:hypothetical protein